MPSDADLIKKIIKNGSKEASEMLIERYYDALYCFLYRQLGNKEDSLDVTQEVFISVLNSIQTYDVKKASFKTWLFQIGTYKVIDRRRKKQVVYEELEDYHEGQTDDLLAQFVEHELLESVNDYVMKFHPDIQKVFRLKIYGDFTFKEISSLLNQSEEKVKAQYYRLVKKIRKEFQENER